MFKLIRLRRQLIRKDAFSPMRMRAYCEDKGDRKRGTANGGAGWQMEEQDGKRRSRMANGGAGWQTEEQDGEQKSEIAAERSG